jgi:predicted transcriptional regulator of viral defense system
MMQKIMNSIPYDRMILSIEELKKGGLTHYKINQLVDGGKLKKLNKKYYENLEFQGEESEFYYVSAFAPKGVVCLMSAAVYYDLSTYRPSAIDVAIRRKARISTLPDWPRLQIFYFTDNRYDAGVERVEDGSNSFQIYDIEKTVVDIISFKEKIGIEETKEVLTTYLRRRDRDLNRLIRYAELLKCKDVLNNYLEVLV